MRNTRFENSRARGWLHSLNVGFAVGSRATVDLTHGLRTENDIDDTTSREQLHWTSVDLDFFVGRGWSLFLSTELNRGGGEDNDTYYSGITQRF